MCPCDPMTTGKGHDVFISYSRDVGENIVRGLQTWLQLYAKPWWHRRALKVFRDRTDLTLTPKLWPAIARAISHADWFVLVASRQAAKSKWVKREVRHWLGDAQVMQRPIEALDHPLPSPDRERCRRLLIVLVDGNIKWREGGFGMTADFDWQSTDALPRCLTGVFSEEPGWLDLDEVTRRPAGRHVYSRSNPAFIEAVAKLSATIRDIDLSVLIGEDSRRHRQAIRTAKAAAASLLFLAIATAIGAWLALVAARTADWQRRIAVAERTVAEARAMTVLKPSALPQAGVMARGAYLDIQALVEASPSPAWLRDVLHGLARLGFDWARPLASAMTFNLSVGTITSMDEVMCLADDLTPELVAAWSADGIESVSVAAVLPDGQSIAFLHDNVSELWQPGAAPVSPPRLVRPLVRVNGRENLALSGNGTLVALETRDNMVRVYTTQEGRCTHEIDPKAVFPASAFEPRAKTTATTSGVFKETFVVANAGARSPLLAGLAIDYDGNRLMLVSKSGFARLVSIRPSKPMEPLGEVWRLEIPFVDDYMRMGLWVMDANGKHLAATPSSFPVGQAPVMVWHAVNGTATARMPLIHEDTVAAIAFSGDGTQLATGVTNGNIFVWGIDTATRERSLDMGTPVRSLAFGSGASDGTLLVGGDGLTRAFDLSTRREIARAPQAGRVDTVAWAPDGRHFITAAILTGGHAPLRFWGIEAAQRVAPIRMRSTHGLHRVVSSAGVLAAIGWPSNLYVWDSATGGILQPFGDVNVLRRAIAMDPAAGRIVALAPAQEGLAYVFDLATGKRTTIAGPGLPTTASSNRKPYLAAACLDAGGHHLLRLIGMPPGQPGLLELWDLDTSACQLSLPCEAECRDAALAPDGARIAWLIHGTTPRLTVRSVMDEASIWSVLLHTSEKKGVVGSHVVFSLDGTRVGVTTGSVIQVFDAATGAATGPPINLGDSVGSIALDTPGLRVVASLASRRLVLADVISGRVSAVRAFDCDNTGGGAVTIADHDSTIYAVFGDRNINNPRVWRWRLSSELVSEALATRLPPIVAVEPNTLSSNAAKN